MKIKQLHIIKLSTVFIGVCLFLCSFYSASASTLVSQTVKTSNYNAATDQKGQTFTGVSGTMVSVVFSASSNNGSQTLGMRLYSCTTSACSSITSIQASSDTYTLTGTQTDYTFHFSSVTLSSGTIYLLVPQRGTYNVQLLIYGNAGDAYANGVCGPSGLSGACSGVSDAYFAVYDQYGGTPAPPSNGLTQIISFSPPDGTTTPNTSVTYTYQIYIADGDLGFWSGYRMLFYDQMQPIGLGTYFIDNVSASTTGYYTYSTTTVMSPGNHIVNACLQKYYLGNIIGGFDLSGNSCQYHQFVVGTSTFVGNLFQNGISSIQSQVNTLAATSSLAVLGTYCNPFSGFDIVQCVYALLIPTSSQLKDTMNTFYSDFLTRVPWGYGSVAVADLLGYGATATTSLSASNLTIVLPNTGVFATATSTSVLKGKSMTFIDWNQMASSTVQSYWSPALAPLNSFLNIMMGGGFIFWLYHFFKKMRP